jgi:hypothetical protein
MTEERPAFVIEHIRALSARVLARITRQSGST